jgi:hypothetical protein
MLLTSRSLLTLLRQLIEMLLLTLLPHYVLLPLSRVLFLPIFLAGDAGRGLHRAGNVEAAIPLQAAAAVVASAASSSSLTITDSNAICRMVCVTSAVSELMKADLQRHIRHVRDKRKDLEYSVCHNKVGEAGSLKRH